MGSIRQRVVFTLRTDSEAMVETACPIFVVVEHEIHVVCVVGLADKVVQVFETNEIIMWIISQIIPRFQFLPSQIGINPACHFQGVRYSTVV